MTESTSTIRLTGIPDLRLAQLTRDFERDLSRAGIRARQVEVSGSEGDRGEPITLGVVALALVSHGAVTALIECLRAYLSREQALAIRMTGPDGTHVEVTGRNVNTPAIQAALKAAISAEPG